MLKTTKFVMGCLTIATLGTGVLLPKTVQAEEKVTIQIPFEDYILDGESCQLTATTAEGDSVSVKNWKSTNESVATIDPKKGILKACTSGKVNITVEDENGGEYSCEIFVKSNQVTEYNGVDYAAVYDFNYYVNNPDAPVSEELKSDPQAAIANFVESGMHGAVPGCANFNPIQYAKQYPDIRHAIHQEGQDIKYYEDLKNNGGYDWTPFYMHYVNEGYNAGLSGRSASEEWIGYATVYDGVDYAGQYDCNQYLAENPGLSDLFGADDIVVLEHYVKYGGGNPAAEEQQ